MEYGIVLFFNDSSNNKIHSLRQDVVNNNVNNHTLCSKVDPHITLGVVSKIDVTYLITKIQQMVIERNTFNIVMKQIGLFTHPKKVVYLIPTIDHQWMEIHHWVVNEFNDFLGHDYYGINQWIPHLTIASRLNDQEVLSAVKLLNETFTSLELTIESIGIIEEDREVFRCYINK